MRKYQQAFTMIELMVTVAVLSIVVAMAVPSFNRQIQNNRIFALADELAGAIALARDRASMRGRASICASADGLTCSLAGDWRTGFIVFVDLAPSDTTPVPTVGEILMVRPAPEGRPQINVSDNKSFIRFLNTGAMARLDPNPVDITVMFEGCKGEGMARSININTGGMVNVVRADCP